MEAKTAITVTSELPAEQRDLDLPYQCIVGDLTGYREPPSEDEDDAVAAARQAERFAAIDVNPTNYDEALRKWKPRFKGKVSDVLTGDAQRTLDIDVEFHGRHKSWPGELDRSVPEIVKIDEMIRELERLQATLSRKVMIRDRLEGLLRAALPAPVTKSKK
jgi:type VI secretion system ImpB/VipA family protein